ncbi:hypothetical protein ACFFX0_17140 [Citricoccus parietis]|uniref:Uncharacterized protein n=1 Tax=Citricoccus parietis TaxID=592307 RepID=A0ABV5G1L7_9MICC
MWSAHHNRRSRRASLKTAYQPESSLGVMEDHRAAVTQRSGPPPMSRSMGGTIRNSPVTPSREAELPDQHR